MKPSRAPFELDAMLNARLDALVSHVHADVSFGTSAGDDDRDAVREELRRLYEPQPGEDGASSPPPAPGDGKLLQRARSECVELLRGILRAISHALVVETGEAPASLRTTVGLSGDVTTYVTTAGVDSPVADHVAAVEAAVAGRTRRLCWIAMLVVAARRLALVLAAPGASWTTLPLLYWSAKDIYQAWNKEGS